MIRPLLVQLTKWQCALGHRLHAGEKRRSLQSKLGARISDWLGELIARIAPLAATPDSLVTQPSVLIAMPTFQGEEWVDEAIESVLQLKDAIWHLYIVDDGSTDKTPEKLKRWKANHPDDITLHLLEKNSYPANSINQCLRWFIDHPEFDVFTLLDQDDVILPDALSRSLRLLGPHSKVVRCKVSRYNKDFSEWFFDAFAWAQLFIAREVIERVGFRKDRSVDHPSDTDYLNRIFRDAAEQGYAVVPTRFTCQKMRVHGANQILRQSTKSAKYLKHRLSGSSGK